MKARSRPPMARCAPTMIAAWMGIEALRCLGIALAVAAPLLAGPSSAHAGRYFVSVEGNDASPGTLERPFATLQRAQRAARQAKGREPVTIYLRGGTHYLSRHPDPYRRRLGNPIGPGRLPSLSKRAGRDQRRGPVERSEVGADCGTGS